MTACDLMMKWFLNVSTLRMPGMILSFSVCLSWVRDPSVVCGMMIIACSCASSECNHYLWKSATDALPDKSWQAFLISATYCHCQRCSTGQRMRHCVRTLFFFFLLSFVSRERRWNETRQINKMIRNGGGGKESRRRKSQSLQNPMNGTWKCN